MYCENSHENKKKIKRGLFSDTSFGILSVERARTVIVLGISEKCSTTFNSHSHIHMNVYILNGNVSIDSKVFPFH